MRKGFKVFGRVIVGILLLTAIGIGGFVYKVVYGFPFYESTPPEMVLQDHEFSVLLFNKTNGFRHGEAISESTKAFEQMAADAGWNLFITEKGGVFNSEQLALFDVVIWNNVTGKVLSSDQREAFQAYIESGGGYVGIHGAGDFSHYWDWYEEELIGATFSHHTMNPGVQSATMNLECDSVSVELCGGLLTEEEREDEWYVFLENPRNTGFTPIYTVDEETFDPNGNFLFLVKDKDFGMGVDHPIVWYKELPGGGRTFYSAIGHTGASFQEENHLRLLQQGIEWAGR